MHRLAISVNIIFLAGKRIGDKMAQSHTCRTTAATGTDLDDCPIDNDSDKDAVHFRISETRNSLVETLARTLRTSILPGEWLSFELKEWQWPMRRTERRLTERG